MQTPSLFYSKLLLFGEYTVILGGTALAIPNRLYYGYFQQNSNIARPVEKNLDAWLQYIKSNAFNSIDIVKLENDIAHGWVFESNIPIGYGLGSSGALVAATYDRYKIYTTHEDLHKTKENLSALESFFHHKSSGLDPIVSYYNAPVLFKGNQLQILNNTALLDNLNYTIFLIDTQMSRQTSTLVKKFNENYTSSFDFKKSINSLLEINEQLIQCLLNKNELDWSLFKILSNTQLEQMKDFIPKTIVSFWRKGLDSDQYLLKLCGAGGGGMLIGITKYADTLLTQQTNTPKYILL